MADDLLEPIMIRDADVPEGMFRIANPLIKLTLSSPLHGLMDEQLMLLRWQGRKTGRQYTTPVGYKQDGNRLTVFTFSPWQANFRDPHPAEVKLKRQWRRGIGVMNDDPRAAASFVKQSVAAGGAGAYCRFRMEVEGAREPTVEELIPEVARRNMVLITIELED